MSILDPFLSPGWKLSEYLQHKEGPSTPPPVYKAGGKAKKVTFKNVDVEQNALSPSLENSYSSDAASLSLSDIHVIEPSSSDLVFVSESSIVQRDFGHSSDPVLSTPPPAYLARPSAAPAQPRDSFNPFLW